MSVRLSSRRSPVETDFDKLSLRKFYEDASTVTTAHFDTHADPAAGAALAEFLSNVSPEATVAVAASDEASFNVTEAVVQAMQHLGSQVDLRGCFRCSHAFIRFQDGRTLEQLDPLQPVKIGHGPTAPQVAFWVDFVKVE